MLWLPVLFGGGIALYFALPSEPPARAGISAFASCAVFSGLAWRVWAGRVAVVLGLAALAVIAAGFAVAQIRSQMVTAPRLERSTGAVFVEGLVQEVEAAAEAGVRVTLAHVVLEGDLPRLERARLRLKPYGPSVGVGQRIRVRAMLSPPMPPVAPGAFDFSRQAWFLRLGGVGFAIGAAEILPDSEGAGPAESLRLAMNGLRHAITARILAVLPGSEGGVAAALVTSEVGAIPRTLLDDYRDSGLAHLLSISGLHMSLLAGLVFFLVRGGLALFPQVALRRPIKKWAAGAALAATFFYMLLAGAPAPTQRAFLMTGIVLVAVLLDRQALSMRLVAWAALVVLAFQPEMLIGPSFQMSFAAVVALIAVYEVISPRLAAWRAERPGWWAPVMLYVGGVLLSTLVAGTATAAYGVFHFNRFATFSVIANLLAVPLTGFAVMPFALVGMLLMPFGLEGSAFQAMGLGLEVVNLVAARVAALPGAAITFPVLPMAGLVLFTLGGCWLCLWRGGWRRWGVPAMVAGLSFMAFADPPDLLIDGRGRTVAVRLLDGSLLVGKGSRMVRETWERRFGPLAAEPWPKDGRSEDGRLACDSQGCLWRDGSRTIALVWKDEAVGARCADSSELMVAAVPVRQACRGAKAVIDRFDVWRRGAHAAWLEGEGVRIETVAGHQGRRPWSHKAAPRRKKPAVPDPVPDPGEAGDD